MAERPDDVTAYIELSRAGLSADLGELPVAEPRFDWLSLSGMLIGDVSHDGW